MLVEQAKAFESSQIKGLFHFVRFIEQCREYDMDYGEANTMSEDQDLVRISSIHKVRDWNIRLFLYQRSIRNLI